MHPLVALGEYPSPCFQFLMAAVFSWLVVSSLHLCLCGHKAFTSSPCKISLSSHKDTRGRI